MTAGDCCMLPTSVISQTLHGRQYYHFTECLHAFWLSGSIIFEIRGLLITHGHIIVLQSLQNHKMVPSPANRIQGETKLNLKALKRFPQCITSRTPSYRLQLILNCRADRKHEIPIIYCMLVLSFDFSKMLHVRFIWPDMNQSGTEAYNCTAVPLLPCGIWAAFLITMLPNYCCSYLFPKTSFA